ncbi:MAG: PEGA domain-containing protein [Candidatus Thermoplasmatota archaeon]|nr:PEGA domain-containing protein [Candidatus Thermoplasmatota archaeon]
MNSRHNSNTSLRIVVIFVVLLSVSSISSVIPSITGSSVSTNVPGTGTGEEQSPTNPLHITDSSIANLNQQIGSYQNGYSTLYGSLYLKNNSFAKGALINGSGASQQPIDVAFDQGRDLLYVIVSQAIFSALNSSIVIINMSTNSIVSNLSLPDDPVTMTYDSVDGYMIVAYMNSDNITVLNGTTVVRNISAETSASPYTGWNGITLDYDPARDYLFYSSSGNLTVIDLNNYTVIFSTETTNWYNNYFAYDPSNNYLYVNYLQNSQTGWAPAILNGTTGQFVGYVQNFSSGNFLPQEFIYDEYNSLIYSPYYSGTDAGVYIINTTTNSLMANLTLSESFGGFFAINGMPMAVDAGNGEVAFSYYQESAMLINTSAAVTSNNVYIINNTKLSGNFTAVYTSDVVFNQNNGILYVASSLFSGIEAINTRTGAPTAWMNLETSFGALSYNRHNGYVYSVNDGMITSGEISIMNPNSERLIGNITVGWYPFDTITNTNNGDIYVSNFLSNNISIISNRTVIGSINGVHSPTFLAFDPVNAYLYVTSFYSRNLTIISTINETIVKNITLQSWGDSLAYDAKDNYLYLAEADTGNITVINCTSNRIQSVIPIGFGLPASPEYLTYDSTAGSIYVDYNWGPYLQNLAVSEINGMKITGGINVSYNNFIGDLYYSTVDHIVFAMLNSGNLTMINTGNNMIEGNLSLGSSPASLTFDTENKQLFVANGPGITIFNLSTTYSVNFSENNLPSDSAWLVNITGVSSSETLTFASYDIYLPNGTYSYTVAAYNKTYAPTPPSGSFTVNGSAVSQSVTFTEVKYPVTFTESGLSSGTTWYVNLTNGDSFNTTGTYVDAYLANATYSYTIGTPNKEYAAQNGTFTINGKPQTVAISFEKEVFDQVFQESGLPSGTSWSVDVSGNTYVSMSNQVTVPLVNGSYNMQIISPSGYFASPSRYIFNVNGESSEFPVMFAYSSNETYIKPVANMYPTFNQILSGNTLNTSYLGQYISFGMAYDNSNGMLFIPELSTTNGTGYIYVYNIAMGQFVKSISSSSSDAVYDPSTGYVYAISSTGNLSEISPSTLTIVKNLTLAESVNNETLLQQQGNYIYALSENGEISQVSASTMSLLKTIQVGPDYGIDVVFAVYGQNAYVADSAGNDLMIINFTTSAIKYIYFPSNYGVQSVVQFFGPELLIGGENYSNQIYNVSNGVLTSIPRISGIATSSIYDPVSHFVYIFSANYTLDGIGNVTVMNLNHDKIVSRIPGVVAQLSPAFISANQSVYVDDIYGAVSEYSVQHYYTATFTESGLPSGVGWYINGSGISGHELSSANITFNLANGTYTFTATNLSNYYTTTVHFSVVISGNNVTETVDYYHWAYIAGKVSPSNATVTINGKAVSLSSSGSFNVSVANGTYHVVASSSGYTSYYNNFTLNSGNTKNLTMNLKPISKPSTISSTELYAIIGVVVAVAAILGVVFVKKRR